MLFSLRLYYLLQLRRVYTTQHVSNVIKMNGTKSLLFAETFESAIEWFKKQCHVSAWLLVFSVILMIIHYYYYYFFFWL